MEKEFEVIDDIKGGFSERRVGNDYSEISAKEWLDSIEKGIKEAEKAIRETKKAIQDTSLLVADIDGCSPFIEEYIRSQSISEDNGKNGASVYLCK